MLDRLKEYIFRYCLSKQPKREVKWEQWNNVRNILVLYESDWTERNVVIKQLRDSMLLEDKDVTIWGFVDKRDITSLILPQSRILGARDLTLYGAPKQEVIEELQKRYYDLLIDLTQHPSLPLKYLSLYTRASLKIGLQLGEGIHDFMVSMPAEEDPKHLFEQMKYYLSTIRSQS